MALMRRQTFLYCIFEVMFILCVFQYMILISSLKIILIIITYNGILGPLFKKKKKLRRRRQRQTLQLFQIKVVHFQEKSGTTYLREYSNFSSWIYNFNLGNSFFFFLENYPLPRLHFLLFCTVAIYCTVCWMLCCFGMFFQGLIFFSHHTRVACILVEK